MKSSQSKALLMLAVAALFFYAIERIIEPWFGMEMSLSLCAIGVAAITILYVVLINRETDEREQLIRLQADSVALYTIIASLLAAAILFPASEFAMMFWLVFGGTVLVRIIAILYHRYK